MTYFAQVAHSRRSRLNTAVSTHIARELTMTAHEIQCWRMFALDVQWDHHTSSVIIYPPDGSQRVVPVA